MSGQAGPEDRYSFLRHDRAEPETQSGSSPHVRCACARQAVATNLLLFRIDKVTSDSARSVLRWLVPATSSHLGFRADGWQRGCVLPPPMDELMGAIMCTKGLQPRLT
jgi:hypothetical protein